MIQQASPSKCVQLLDPQLECSLVSSYKITNMHTMTPKYKKQKTHPRDRYAILSAHSDGIFFLGAVGVRTFPVHALFTPHTKNRTKTHTQSAASSFHTSHPFQHTDTQTMRIDTLFQTRFTHLHRRHSLWSMSASLAHAPPPCPQPPPSCHSLSALLRSSSTNSFACPVLRVPCPVCPVIEQTVHTIQRLFPAVKWCGASRIADATRRRNTRTHAHKLYTKCGACAEQECLHQALAAETQAVLSEMQAEAGRLQPSLLAKCAVQRSGLHISSTIQTRCCTTRMLLSAKYCNSCTVTYPSWHQLARVYPIQTVWR